MAYIMDTNEEERAKGKTVEVRQIASARHVGLVGLQKYAAWR
jgi:translation elongation factor EF-1alpha